MKKYLSWIVCSILLITAWILPSNSPSSIAGAGVNLSAKIENVEELGNVLSAFSKNKTLNVARTQLLAASTDTPLSQGARSNYTSVTCTSSTSSSVSISYSTNESSSVYGRSSYSMERSMTLCATENETFYDVSARIYSSSESRRNGYSYNSEMEYSSVGITMEFQLYVNEADKLSYINISRFDTNSTSSNDDNNDNEAVKELNNQKARMLNKWISTDSVNSSFMSINNKNYQQLSIIGSAILLAETGDFIGSGNVFSMSESASKQLCADLAGVLDASLASKDAFDDASFTVNLSAKNRPSFELLYTMSENSSPYEIKAGERLTCRLSNINNTVIRFPKNVKIYSAKDFE